MTAPRTALRHLAATWTAAVLFGAPAADALVPGDSLKISEIHYDPSGTPPAAHEFIELFNAGSQTVYLDGAVITDEGNTGTNESTFRFPGLPGETNWPVAPGQHVLLVPDATGSPYSGIDFEFFAGGTDSDHPQVPNLVKTSGLATELSLGNSGDGITLSQGLTTGNVIPCGEVVDGVSWEGGGGEVTALSDTVCTDASPHPGVTQGSMSLQRCLDGTDSDQSSDFIVATLTPGGPNDCPVPPTILSVDYAPCAPVDSEPVLVSAQVVDNNGDLQTVRVFFKNFFAAVFDSLDLVQAGDSLFQAMLPGQLDESRMHYYVAARDSAATVSVWPAGAPAETRAYRVGITDIRDIQFRLAFDTCVESPLLGQPVNVVGVVTHHAREFSDCYFFVQQGADEYRGLRVFIEDGSFVPELGDSVQVSGIVSEFNCQTQVEAHPGCATVLATGAQVVPRVLGSLLEAENEQNESQLVTIPGPIPVLTTFQGGVFNGELHFEFQVGTQQNPVWVGNDTFEPDSVFYSIDPQPGMELDALTGIISWRPTFLNGDSLTVLRLEPRRDNDVDRNFTDVADGGWQADRLRLLPGRPNPFRPKTTLAFALPDAGPVYLDVFDAGGRRVRRLLAGEVRSVGPHAVVWDGRNDRGQPLATGVYLVRLQTRGRAVSGKVHLLR